MKKIMVIMKKDLRETLHTKAFYVSIGIALFVLVTLGMGVGNMIETLMEGESSLAETTLAIQSAMGTLVFMFSLMLMMLFLMYINAYALTMEKVNRSMESLLCTPLSLKQIWLGKTLAISLPSIILGLLFAFAGIVGINQFLIGPKLGHFIMPGAAPLVAIFVAAPLIVFFLTSLITALQLVITNIRWISAALLGIIFAAGYGLSPVLKFGPSSWSIVFASLGSAAMLALIVVLLSSRVTKERIVLSSKG